MSWKNSFHTLDDQTPAEELVSFEKSFNIEMEEDIEEEHNFDTFEMGPTEEMLQPPALHPLTTPKDSKEPPPKIEEKTNSSSSIEKNKKENLFSSASLGEETDFLEDSQTGSNIFWIGIMLCFVIIATASIRFLWIKNKTVSLGFTCDSYKRQLKDLKLERKRLKQRLMELESPARLMKIAKQDLGLTAPTREQLISKEQVLSQLHSFKNTKIRIAQKTHTPNLFLR